MRVSPPPVPALVEGTVTHSRRAPLTNAFTHPHYQWLVDVDDLPRFPWLLGFFAGFDARDHLDGGRLGGGIRGDVERFLEARGVTLAADDRVLMLANARVLGHVFDPLSVFWCLRPDGELVAVVFEVHNTYGERHAYLLDVAEDGTASVDKAFYVSPFNDVSGTYAVSLLLDERVVGVSVRLDRDGERVLTAVTRGTASPATPRALRSVIRRHGLMTQRVTALIRLHGIRLWLRRLPVTPRPPHPEEAVR
ncbi:hypothetical protein N865_05130 [Intrasporangium oryzae NRRL B-24470]|uniref:Cyclopropane fatty acid synthase n=1 Tax=Intrasporangium oryzae NRRL B-24470 TaxID=1386089 RepID=W9GF30_9MICO|nr:DUF1365 domain-containing protein [Intrasporangium oryzae]EWT02474.1 hypothetical protein N865_05130 [Intrasporangium oryzae NRRL B-24470]